MDHEAVETAEHPCQRWRQGKAHYRRRSDGPEFDRRQYSVDVIDESIARKFVMREHYSRSYPAAVFRVGLFGPNAHLEGVAVFSVPMNQSVIPSYTGVHPSEGAELGRFVLVDRTPANGETFFLGRAFRLLHHERPNLRAIVSYSDPVPRKTATGLMIMPGHIGTIYQAHNGRYMGRASARTLHVGPDGCVLSPRSISKIRLGESGCDSAQRRLEAIGAPPREFGESGADWVSRVLTCGLFRVLRHPGSFCYGWPIGSSTTRRLLERGFRPALPYPKHIFSA